MREVCSFLFLCLSSVWFVLKTMPCVLKENMYWSVRWSILYISVRSSWVIMMFKSSTSFLLFCLVLSFTKRRVLKSSAVIVELVLFLSILVFNSHILGFLINVYRFIIGYILLIYWFSYHYNFLSLVISLSLKF